MATPTARSRDALQQLLDAMWDFGSPEVSEQRFREAWIDDSSDAHHRAVMATQLVRALGLQSKFSDADAVLDALAGSEPPGEIRARIELERGRLLVSRDAPADAIAHFERAVDEAAAVDAAFLEVDALHMLAIADAGNERDWAQEGLAIVHRSGDSRLKRWGVALHNNLGWTEHDAGDAAAALEHFEAALLFANDHGSAEQRHVARWAVGRCLRTLGRDDEALAIQRELAEQRPDDPFVGEEIAALTGTEPPT
ncbi:tetratricopeptide repeat protein [uncultured Demequina sp.]|uniref:tetratricopeptide repeat protein n=1 Tax=uncultured Demequina sp. TaxID=693499 RepID=UPI0025F6401D|nr:hypothetical protein [uncultured Demequina sp.]